MAHLFRSEFRSQGPAGSLVRSYQRGSRRRELSPPPPLRFPPPPPKRLPPPPPPDGRASRGRASLTVRLRPSSCEPLRASIARSAPESSVISTKPKPRDFPVSRSFTNWARST